MTKKKISNKEIQIIEALLFASEDILTQSKLNLCFDSGVAPDLSDGIKHLQEQYQKSGRAFFIDNVAGGFRLVSLPEFAPWIHKLLSRSGKTSLSKAALETLAVLAYRGPASRAEVENIRGVNCAGVIKTLLDKKLLKIKGRGKGPGRPLLYSVTEAFLLSFGLNSIADLPKLKEITELIAEGASESNFISNSSLSDGSFD
ncbi:MAG: SMC-Scp complex subunit ScpB [Candidatus Marinimicrobia bacterium]|nr:SMC-Scp complex subunit ScpB [Candidatus Neomarinimicrobiota bacterium]MBF89392.1 SMC-Scp complex subunit ScpB [Candidatus Neomarinimicrobiota bacterium]|tara:strand:+ start:89 stop:691 length:603 start_codon:yes stop_codon:yes gene_type:complete